MMYSLSLSMVMVMVRMMVRMMTMMMMMTVMVMTTHPIHPTFLCSPNRQSDSDLFEEADSELLASGAASVRV